MIRGENIKNKYRIENDVVYIEIIRRNGDKFEALIDLEDLEKIKQYTWHVDCFKTAKHPFYVRTTIYQGMINGKPKYKSRLLHSIILEVDENILIDHRNNNPLDNRKENLRITEHNKNLKNRSSKNSNNTTGYRNVSWIKNENAYIVQLQINGKNKRLGKFTDAHEAGKFAEEMRKKHYGKFAGKN